MKLKSRTETILSEHFNCIVMWQRAGASEACYIEGKCGRYMYTYKLRCIEHKFDVVYSAQVMHQRYQRLREQQIINYVRGRGREEERWLTIPQESASLAINSNQLINCTVTVRG